MGLYQPEIDKLTRQELRAKRKAKREKYKKLYKEELAKERAKLQAEKEKEIELYKTKSALDKAKRQARRKVKPFSPRNGLKLPTKRLSPEQKRKLKKAGYDTGKSVVWLGQKGLNLLDTMYGGGKGGLKLSKKKSTKRKSYKRKSTKKKSSKRKGKTYYCRKCHKRHSFTSKIGRKHRK